MMGDTCLELGTPVPTPGYPASFGSPCPAAITHGAAIDHHHPVQGCSPEYMAPEHPKAAGRRVGSRTVVAQCCGGRRTEPVPTTHTLN